MMNAYATFSPRAVRSAQTAYADPRVIEDRVRRFLPLVHKAAWHIYGAGRDGLEVEDLVQAGLVALTDCARRHEPPATGEVEDGFAAYAKMRVRGAMFDCLRKLAPASRGTMKRLAQSSRHRAEFLGQHGREPSPAELAQLLGISPEAMLALEGEQIHLTPLDSIYDDTAAAFAEPEADAFAQLCDAQESSRLAECIANLPERLQLVLQLYFIEELNLAEIAGVLEVSVPRVHQLKAGALDKLKTMLAETDLA
ncbi:sigma-70 family RNA polymerase sigma factor [Altererythrobacter confluentis]|uniref:Sigma-70 family RNA polymerase sigma factor n=1 Tax=Allopontixanthobacter confluentis TaxID=1849021 RepID=A0A6L7GCH3_9SPHN|nr:sigma-70 family RNA polymerase sigma factor [Allopontixanthobacter confluentis]MXP13659.1 sigma-70 family RNA polymerase sigma factor [Allopontixanthobacter confluentis]